MIDIHPVQLSLSDEVKRALAAELHHGGLRGGTLYVGPSAAVQGQCFLLLIGGGRPAFSRASTTAHFLAPDTAIPAIREFIAVLLTDAPSPSLHGTVQDTDPTLAELPALRSVPVDRAGASARHGAGR